MNPIQAFVKRLQLLTPIACKRLNKQFSAEQAMIALCIDSNITVDEAASINWDEDTLVEALRNCTSIKELPELIAIAEFDESIVPLGTEHGLYEELVKHKGEQWFIHKHDADPFPSNPHAHNYEKNLKLHLGNGCLYFGTKQVGCLSSKALLSLRDKVKHVELPPCLIS